MRKIDKKFFSKNFRSSMHSHHRISLLEYITVRSNHLHDIYDWLLLTAMSTLSMAPLIFRFSRDQFCSFSFLSIPVRRMPFGLSDPATSQTHHRRPRFVFGRRLVDSPNGNRETAVAPWGNRNRI